MKSRILILFLFLHVYLFSQNNSLKKIYESEIGIYYSTTNNLALILKLDSFLLEKREKTFELFKYKLSKPIKFEFYRNENEILCNCGWDTTKLNRVYERLVCTKNTRIQITDLHSSTIGDSLYSKWGGLNKVVYHQYLHLLLKEAYKPDLPKCFSEGITVFYSQQLKFDKDVKDVILEKTKTNYIPTVKELLSDKKITRFPNIYHWSFLFCKFIIDSYGWDRMLQILNAPENFYKILERPKEKIESEWNRYLVKKYPDM